MKKKFVPKFYHPYLRQDHRRNKKFVRIFNSTEFNVFNSTSINMQLDKVGVPLEWVTGHNRDSITTVWPGDTVLSASKYRIRVLRANGEVISFRPRSRTAFPDRFNLKFPAGIPIPGDSLLGDVLLDAETRLGMYKHGVLFIRAKVVSKHINLDPEQKFSLEQLFQRYACEVTARTIDGWEERTHYPIVPCNRISKPTVRSPYTPE